MKRLIYMVLAACVLVPAFAAPADVDRRIRQFEQGLAPVVLVTGEKPALKSLTERMAELKVPGVSVAVIHQGRIEWARGYGVAKSVAPRSTEKSLFQAASISKPVFALAVHASVGRGQAEARHQRQRIPEGLEGPGQRVHARNRR